MKNKKHRMHTINNTSSNTSEVESIATNLVIGDVLRLKMKKKKIKGKLNIKIDSLKEYSFTVDRKGILVGTVGRRKTAIIIYLRKQKEPLMETEMLVLLVLFVLP